MEKEDLVEAVGPLLVSSDFAPDDKAGEDLAGKLHDALTLSRHVNVCVCMCVCLCV